MGESVKQQYSFIGETKSSSAHYITFIYINAFYSYNIRQGQYKNIVLVVFQGKQLEKKKRFMNMTFPLQTDVYYSHQPFCYQYEQIKNSCGELFVTLWLLICT